MLWRRIHALAAAIFVVAIVAQVVLAGLAIANLGGSGDFSQHAEFGYTWVGFAGLALVVTALIARRPRRDALISLGLLLLYIVQTLLPAAKGSMPFLAALHPLNAMFLFALAAWYAWRTSRAAMASSLEVIAAPATPSATAAGVDR
jgi:hypothetical protein